MRHIHALSGILTCDPSNQAAANLHLRPHSYQDQQKVLLGLCNFVYVCVYEGQILIQRASLAEH